MNSKPILDRLFDETADSIFDELIGEHLTEFDKEAYEDNEFPVDVQQFVEDAHFLDLKGQIYPEVMQLLWDIEADGLIHLRRS